MHQATVRGFDIREAVFAWLDAYNRKPKAELLPILCSVCVKLLTNRIFSFIIVLKKIQCFPWNQQGSRARLTLHEEYYIVQKGETDGKTKLQGKGENQSGA